MSEKYTETMQRRERQMGTAGQSVGGLSIDIFPWVSPS